MQRVFSGIQPSGIPTLGNYLGAIRNWVPMQNGDASLFCVVDQHAITVWQDPKELARQTREMAAALIAGGLDPEPPIKALMVYNSNPVVVCPDQERLIEGLSREDLFLVVSEHFMTDTAQYADLVLPATTQLEQEDVMFSPGAEMSG